MKIFSFRRLLGMAAIYGAVRYIRAHGGPKAAFEELRSKAMDLVASARSAARDGASKLDESMSGAKAGPSFATNVGRGPSSSESPTRGSSYASYDLDSDDKLRH